MTYSALAVLAVVAVLVVDLAVYRTRLVTRPVFWAAYTIVVVFQLLMNGVLTGRGVVTYDPETIWGLRIVYAPVEEVLFFLVVPLCAILAFEAVRKVTGWDAGYPAEEADR
jgi:lycopene cyclase domain-containing protein